MITIARTGLENLDAYVRRFGDNANKAASMTLNDTARWARTRLKSQMQADIRLTESAFAGQRLGPNICYEDLFGEELARGFVAPALAPTVLVNLSNIAWFGDTVAIAQHRQISRLRALELQRPMLRATNTGATLAIDHLGRVTHELPRLTRAVH